MGGTHTDREQNLLEHFGDTIKPEAIIEAKLDNQPLNIQSLVRSSLQTESGRLKTVTWPTSRPPSTYIWTTRSPPSHLDGPTLDWAGLWREVGRPAAGTEVAGKWWLRGRVLSSTSLPSSSSQLARGLFSASANLQILNFPFLPKIKSSLRGNALSDARTLSVEVASRLNIHSIR